MKKYPVFITIVAFALFAFAFSSCEKMMGNFLDKAPSTDVTEDTVFSSKQNTLDFLSSIYEYGVHSNLPYATVTNAVGKIGYANPEATLWSGTSDESKCTTNWYFPQIWNNGTVNATSGGGNIDGRFDYRFTAIRMISVLLDRIDGVPEDDTNNWKEQFKAEARVLRAMNYFEMLKRYGGMPIIDKRLDPNQDIDLTRKSIKEMVDFIVSDCDSAINSPLPAFYGSVNPDELALKGRIHKGVAYAIKSKTLLYAASPLFNTATPYLDFGVNNPIICYGDYSLDRWKLAADAAKDALDWAAASGCKLQSSYMDAWNVYDNDEIIFAEKSETRIGNWLWPWGEFSRYWPPNQGYGGTSPTLNFIKRYEDKQGNQVSWNGGSDLQEKMDNLDARFAQTVMYNMCYADLGDPKNLGYTAPLYQEAIPTVEGGWGREGAITKCVGGFWLIKGRPTAINQTTWAYAPNSTLYQLDEIYLNYAEALYEYNAAGGNSDAAADAKPAGYTLSARDAINVIRQRAGQPPILTGHSFYPDFRELIRNERAIELAFDNHRFWDIRRWMIAEQDGVMEGNMYGIIINLIDPSVTWDDAKANLVHSGFKYTPYVFENRKFQRRMYLHPITIDNVNRGLLQNPGY